MRRCRGSNPGHPRDRREYSPLYYNDLLLCFTTINFMFSYVVIREEGLLRMNKTELPWNHFNSKIVNHLEDRYFNAIDSWIHHLISFLFLLSLSANPFKILFGKNLLS